MGHYVGFAWVPTVNEEGDADEDDIADVVGPHSDNIFDYYTLDDDGQPFPKPIRVEDCPDTLRCEVLFTDGGAIESRYHDPLAVAALDKFKNTTFGELGGNIKEACKRLGITSGYLVEIDFHR